MGWRWATSLARPSGSACRFVLGWGPAGWVAGSRDLEDCSHPCGTMPRDPPACCLHRRQQTERTAELDRDLGSLFPPLPSTEGNSLREHVICIRSPSQGGRELGSKLSCFLIQSGCPEPGVLKLEKASTCPGGLWKQCFFFPAQPWSF